MASPARTHAPAHEVENGGSEPRLITYTPAGTGESLSRYLRKTWGYRQFILGYAWAELRERYLRNRLATVWLVLNPLLLAATYTFLVLVLRRRANPLDVLTFITSGLFFFMFFRDSIVRSAQSLTRATSLLLSSDLPKATLPAAATVESLLGLTLAMMTYIPLHLVAGGPVTLHLLQMVPILVLATGFCFGISMLLAFIATRFRDIVSMLPYGLRLLLYLSPVLFSLDQIQATLPAALHPAIWMNPLVPFLAAWHDALSGAAVGGSTWLAAAAWAVGALIAGTLVAHRGQHSIGARL